MSSATHACARRSVVRMCVTFSPSSAHAPSRQGPRPPAADWTGEPPVQSRGRIGTGQGPPGGTVPSAGTAAAQGQKGARAGVAKRETDSKRSQAAASQAIQPSQLSAGHEAGRLHSTERECEAIQPTEFMLAIQRRVFTAQRESQRGHS
ncbi:hypothetical protein chiPu_0032990, partial [Chiloscyllium punctatum]|nr:hypothetical protein [Chiloscyllium punctatum]